MVAPPPPPPPFPPPQRLAVVLPVLVHVQTNLSGDLSTAALADVAGLSPTHFHRLFQAVTGETVKQYTLRLRLERAAYRLLVEEGSVLTVAVDCGFRSHETFTRAFRRRYGMPPSAWRAARRPPADATRARDPGPEEQLDTYRLSVTRPVALRATGVVFIRHVGPYEAVDGTAWKAIQRWAESKGIPSGGDLLGVAHDAPQLTDPDRLRFDACLEVPVPVPAAGRVGYQVLDGGHFAVTTFVGPFRSLADAYQRVFERAARLPGYRVVGLPAVEVYRHTVVGHLDALNHTDIRLPLVPLR